MDMDDDEELAPDRLTWRALVRVVGLWQQHPHRNKPSERALLLKVAHELAIADRLGALAGDRVNDDTRPKQSFPKGNTADTPHV